MDTSKFREYMGDLEDELLMEEIEAFLATNPTKPEAMEVIAACQEGMKIIGDRFDSKEYFVGDLVFSGQVMSDVAAALHQVLGGDSGDKLGKIVLGTVQGDLHDIGKNIFSTLVQTAGFEVIDLGIDVAPETFVDAVRKEKPDIVGMSGILTLAVDSMKATIDALKEAGLRDNLPITIGGTAVSADVCQFVGADYFSTNASETVGVCVDLMKSKA